MTLEPSFTLFLAALVIGLGYGLGRWLIDRLLGLMKP